MKKLALTLCAAILLISEGRGQVGFTGNYSENFDTLANSGTSSSVPTGWAFVESSVNANSTYTAGTGSSATGDTYSFGSTGSSERAFGQLRSGSLVSVIGATFVNNTGSTLVDPLVNYRGEQWRLGALGRLDKMDFQFSLNAASISDNTGTWVDVDALDFSAPVQSGTVGALDGNASPNFTNVAGIMSGLSVADGATFRIRWVDTDATGSDDGISIDDFSMLAAVPEPGSILLTTALAAVLGYGAWRRRQQAARAEVHAAEAEAAEAC